MLVYIIIEFDIFNYKKDIESVFFSQKKYKGGFLSYTDCSIIVQARIQKAKQIITFDKAFDQFSDEFEILS